MQSYRFRIPAALAVLTLFACDGPLQPGAAGPEGPEAPETGAVLGSYLDASSYMGSTSASGIPLFAPAAMGEGFVAFTSRDDFEAAAPDLSLEDFENSLVGPGDVRGCPGALNSATDNECFEPGGIRDGISISGVAMDQMVVLGPGFWDVPSRVVGPWHWGDALEITCTSEGGTTAVGFDLLAPNGGPTTVDVELFGSQGELLGTGVAQVGSTSGIFWGVTSEASIHRVVLTPDPDEEVGLLIDDVAFRTVESSSDEGENADEDEADELDADHDGGLVVDVRQGAINPLSQGVIPVAVLSTEHFDATSLDPSTVRFGPLGAEPAHADAKVDDLNGDGLPDLLFHFSTPDTGLACGDTTAELTGETWDGEAVAGVGEVRVLCPAIPARGLETRTQGGRGG